MSTVRRLPVHELEERVELLKMTPGAKGCWLSCLSHQMKT